MVKPCSGKCYKSLEPDAPYYYCCDEAIRYCHSCAIQNKCATCNRPLTKSRTLTVCRQCDTEVDLLRCNCKGAVCKSCNVMTGVSSQNLKCKYCGVTMAPISSTQSHSSVLPNPLTKSNAAISTRQKEKGECSACYALREVEEMFCNICGHSYCKKCLEKYRSQPKCPALNCRELISKEFLAEFLKASKICIVCDKQEEPSKSDISFGVDKNMCEGCYNKLKEESLPPVSEDKLVQSELIKEEKIQLPTGIKTEANKQNVGANPISILKASPIKGATHLEPVPLDKPPLPPVRNNFLNPNVPSNVRADNMRTPDKKVVASPVGSPSPNSITKQGSPNPSTNGRDKSKSNASMIDQSIPVACANCRLCYLPKILLTTNCKSKHKMCRYCTLKFRGKECEVCKIAEQEHLDKYFCYKELNSEEKQQYNAKLSADGLALCFGCNIIVQKNRCFKEKERTYCKPCLLRLK